MALSFGGGWFALQARAGADLPATARDFQTWIAQTPSRQAEVAALDAYLAAQGVQGVVPTWQLLRTDTSWQRCGDPFSLPAQALWPNIVPALRFIRDRIKPALGDLEAVSVYREPTRNQCAGGARASAHTSFHAVDLIPQRAMSAEDIAAVLCPIHKAHGGRARIGLGIYSASRFHIDARGFRKWGPDHKRGSSPCPD